LRARNGSGGPRHRGAGSFKLRHVPLLLTCGACQARRPDCRSETVERVIQRADELTELLAIYWRGGKRPLSKQMKLGLARAFRKFDAYALAKYDRANAVRLRDVLFLTHAKPKDAEQAALWAKLAANELDARIRGRSRCRAGPTSARRSSA
jgi:60 kDa SS-A/Ro ribonucleoprotein